MGKKDFAFKRLQLRKKRPALKTQRRRLVLRPFRRGAGIWIVVLLSLNVYLLVSPRTSLAANGATSQGFRVVLDPGHGGNDQGTVYRKGKLRLAEKDVTLDLALETARQLENQGFDVFLTRRGDQDIPLPSRTAVANQIKADVFISIHMNSHASARAGDAEGIETFILNNATDATSKRLAHFENKSADKNPEKAPDQNDVALILKDLTLDANLSESKRLACAIQNSLVSVTSQTSSKSASQRNRGVKQALFYVLLGADMPSVLVEAGFLTHPRDRKLVTSIHGKRAIGASIVRAIQQFKRNKNTREAQLELSRCKVH